MRAAPGPAAPLRATSNGFSDVRCLVATGGKRRTRYARSSCTKWDLQLPVALATFAGPKADALSSNGPGSRAFPPRDSEEKLLHGGWPHPDVIAVNRHARPSRWFSTCTLSAEGRKKKRATIAQDAITFRRGATRWAAFVERLCDSNAATRLESRSDKRCQLLAMTAGEALLCVVPWLLLRGERACLQTATNPRATTGHSRCWSRIPSSVIGFARWARMPSELVRVLRGAPHTPQCSLL